MNILFSIVLVSFVSSAVADVSHLPQNYLPPATNSALSTAGTQSFDANSKSREFGDSHFSNGAPGSPVAQIYGAPATAPDYSAVTSADVPALQPPLGSLVAPAVENYKSFGSTAYTDVIAQPLFVPVPSSASIPSSQYGAPSALKNSAAASVHLLPQKRISALSKFGAKFSRPHFPASVETFAPVQKSYSGSANFDNHSAQLSAPTSSGTKYAANGGYIY